ncbi:porin [Candidatus Bealeia paramacronuclearis]
MPQLTVSGESTFNVWWFHNQNIKNSNDNDFGQGSFLNENQIPSLAATLTSSSLSGDTQNEYGRGYIFTMDDSRLKFDLSGVSDYGTDYGLVVNIDTNTEQTFGDKTIKETYVWIDGVWGCLTLGNTNGVEEFMAFGGYDPLGGTGGFDGNFDRVVNLVTGTVTSVGIVEGTDKSTKVIYQTPRFYGFQGGLSFAPQYGHLGENKIQSTKDYSWNGDLQPFDRRSTSLALNYMNDWKNGLSLGASLTAVFAKTLPGFSGSQWFIVDQNNTVIVRGAGNRKNTAGYAMGTSMHYKDFQFGVEFGDNGKSHEVKDLKVQTGQETNAGCFMDTGIAYHFGPTKLSFGYMYTKRKAIHLNVNNTFGKAQNRTHILSIDLDHKLAPGAGVYFEYVHLDMKNEGFNVDAMINNTRVTQFAAKGWESKRKT